jgi:N12 class adenine-specific DNA methylase
MLKVQDTPKNLERMEGLHNIRIATMELIEAQTRSCSNDELTQLQAKLNYQYNKFVSNFGNITDKANERIFRHDDDYNTLSALEIVDTKTKSVSKSEIFTKRTIKPNVEITSVDTPQEALQVSMDRLGKVDVPFMAELTHKDPQQLIAELGSAIFRNPLKVDSENQYSGYEESAEYLSGNVREKLRVVEVFAEQDNRYQRNIEALKQVIPKDLEASEISVRIGANWIDIEDYNRFLKEYAKANTDVYGHPVRRTRNGEYKIEGKYQDKSISATQTYGTPRMNSYDIFENLLNQRDIVVKDRVEDSDGHVSYVINQNATQLAKEKARQMKDAFKS